MQAAAVEQHLPITWVVFNNRSFQIERELMFRLYGREAFCDYRKAGQKELWNPDLCKWAESMGAKSIYVTKADHYAPALRRALDNRWATEQWEARGVVPDSAPAARARFLSFPGRRSSR